MFADYIRTLSLWNYYVFEFRGIFVDSKPVEYLRIHFRGIFAYSKSEFLRTDFETREPMKQYSWCDFILGQGAVRRPPRQPGRFPIFRAALRRQESSDCVHEVLMLCTVHTVC